MLPASLILREFGDGSVRFDHAVAETLSVRDLPCTFGIAIAAQVGISFANASASLFFSFRTSVF